VFAGIARELEAETSRGRTQDRVTRAAVRTVEGCDHAAISIVRRRGGIETVGATDEVPSRVDAIQYEVGQGPCLQAIAEQVTVVIDDLAGDVRWPAFCRRAVEETGVRSMVSIRLFVGEDTMGSMNLYSRRAGVFDEQACAVGTVLAAHAAIALSAVADRERAAQLEDALASGREIGMAMGVLMARGGVGREEAFALLRRASQHLHRKLREVAAEVVDTGQLPTRALRPPSD
jgi:transcriptional regulator with GAF, ATPase, and Fis domain